jgi:deferrochelatase/peroxidase EfeB
VHQAAITRPPCRATSTVAFDVIAADRAELRDLLRTITDRAVALTTGGRPAPTGIAAPPADSGVLGPSIPGDDLLVTLGVGASLFDSRFELSDRKPVALQPMHTFPNDELDPKWCHGDLSLQLCAEDTDTVLHALRDIARHTRGGMQIRWRMDGFSSKPRPSGTPRNMFGFKDGIANPTDPELLFAGPGEPTWAKNGSYQVIRLIRMLVEFWDRVSLSEQETMFGRSRDSGAPLGAGGEQEVPDYSDDPAGDVIPLTSHMRLANPRTAHTDGNQLRRRAYNYDNGVDGAGNLDMGQIFTCYQRDLMKQFHTVQTRLVDEPLVDYITPYGGGYFFALPGVVDSSDFFGRGLVS